MKKFLLIILVFAAISSCKKDSATPAPDNSVQIIKDYLKVKNLDSIAQKVGYKSDTMYYIIEKQGTGESIKNRKNVRIYYKGYFPENDSVYFVSQGGNPEDFEDSVCFDESGGIPVNFQLNSVIKGWQMGIPYFKEGAEGTNMEGGSGTLIVPSKLGYNDGKVRIFDVKIDLFY